MMSSAVVVYISWITCAKFIERNFEDINTRGPNSIFLGPSEEWLWMSEWGQKA